MPAETAVDWEWVLGDRAPAGLARVMLAPAELGAAPWPLWVPPAVREQAEAGGIKQPYPHQVAAANAAWEGRDVALATGTATGKSLAYLLPILSAIGDDELLPATTLYLSPTKALAHDQLRKLRGFRLPGLRPGAYDGDTPPEERRWIRRHATVVVSNPDMLHAGILPNHGAWQSFLKRLRFIVIDEFHVYRGLFGANLAAIVRRLLRVVEHHGGSPTVIGTSATVASPAETLQTLTGRPAEQVVLDGGSRSPTRMLLVPPTGDGLVPRTAEVLARLVKAEVRTLAFVRSRRAAEAVSLLAQDELRPHGLHDAIASYRSGYLPEERRDLEQGLRDGRYRGVATTSALELGVDISGLDAVVVAGWPGTRSAFRQRIGRAGRDESECLALFLADNNPLDAFLVRNPDHVTSGAEALVIDADNPFVLGPHLCAAASELPLSDAEAAAAFGPQGAGLLPELGRRGLLRRRDSGWYWTSPERASSLVDVRGISGQPVAVVEEATGRLIGQVDRAAADRTVHKGAVYTHRGQDFLISDLNLDEGLAIGSLKRLPYSTHAQSVHDSRLLDVLDEHKWGDVGLQFGVVEVSTRVTGFLKRRIPTGEVLGAETLDLPTRTMRTKAVWWTVPAHVLSAAQVACSDVAGAAHAIEHAAIGLLPLFAQCDRWDIGGLSSSAHPDTAMCTIVVHDGQPGGAGFAQRGFTEARAWLTATRDAVAGCACEAGCPACVHSPKCGNNNEPLDKPAALALLGAILDT